MNRRKQVALIAIFGWVALGLAGTTRASVTQVKDFADFTYQYDFNTAGQTPDLVDIDTNSVSDFSRSNSAGGTAVVSGGVLTMATTAVAGDNFYSSSAAGQIWDVAAPTLATGYTVEARLKIVNDIAYPMAFLASPGGTNAHAYLRITKTGQVWGTATSLGGVTANDDDFHVFRFAQEPGSATYSVWRDGVLLNGALPSGLNFALDRLVFGDTSSFHAGEVQVDYLGFTVGAFGPVPEPKTILQYGFDHTSGLVASYDDGQGQGVILDDSGNGNNGVVFLHNPGYTADTPPHSLLQHTTGIGSLDLTGDHHAITNNANDLVSNADILAAGGLTIETWVKSPTNDDGGHVISMEGDVVLDATSTGYRFFLASSRSPHVLTADVDKTDWVHLAAVLNHAVDDGTGKVDGVMELYVNNILVGSKDITNPLDLDSLHRTTAFGAHPTLLSGGFRFDGYLFDPRITLGALGPGQFTIAVPEPSSGALLVGLGLVAVAGLWRRKRRRPAP